MKRSFLTALGLEKTQIDQIMDEHGNTVEALKEKHKETEETLKANIKTLEGEKATLERQAKEAPSGGNEELQGKYDELKAEYDTFKQTVETEKATTAATAAVRKQFEADGANPKVIDLLMKTVDLSAVKIKDGAIENWKDVSEPIKTQYADFFGEVTQTGADVGNPPTDKPGETDPFIAGFKEN